MEDLRIGEHSANGATVGYVVPSDADVTNDVATDGLFLESGYGGSTETYTSGQMFGDWTVESGSVQLTHVFADSPGGGYEVAFWGPAGSTINTSLATEVGRQYQVIFQFTGDWTGADSTVDGRVSAAGQTLDFSKTEPAGWSTANLGWEPRSFTFTADSTTTDLSFEKLDTTTKSIVISGVRVVEIQQAVTTLLNSDPTLSYDAATGKFYRIVETPVDWATAITSTLGASLNGISGQLTTIRSDYDNRLLHEMVRDLANDVWIGATDATTDNQWYWLDGDVESEQFWSGTETGTAVGGRFTNWASSEPNDWLGAESHAEMNHVTGEWFDTSDSKLNAYIVEWDASEVLSNVTFTLSDDAGGRFAIDSSSGEITLVDRTLLDYETAPSHDVTVQVTDAAANTYSESITIEIDNALDANQTVPGPQSVNEDTVLTFSSGNGNAVSVSDSVAATDSLMQVSLSVNDGVLTLSGLTGITIIDGAQGSGSLTINGMESAINAALEGLTFTPDSDVNGAVTLNMTTALAADLEGHYTFEAGTANDQSVGVSQDGTLVGGATTIVDPNRGEVLDLSGSGDFVQVSGMFAEPANVTLAAWVNLENVGNQGSDLISLGDNVSLRLDLASGNGVGGHFYDGSTWTTMNSGQYVEGTGWRHVAYVFDDANDVHTIYIDGVAIGSAATTGSISYSLGANTLIGMHGNGDADYAFDGQIDDARVYTRALSADEIAALAADSSSTTGSVAITVDPVNDAPTLGSTSLAAINEDDPDPPGEVISTLFSGLFSDPDAGSSFAGIAIRQNSAPETDGSWQYSTDGGSNWFDVGTRSSTTALVLDTTAMVRFLPAANFHGSPSQLNLKAIDDTYAGGFTLGASQVTANVLTSGGSTPFSASSSSIGASVTSVADDPIATDNTITVAAPGGTATTVNKSDFAGAELTNTGSSERSIAEGDIDGDGDIDLVTAASAIAEWYENDGSGNFTAHTLPAITYSTNEYLTTVDLDSDGDLDIVGAAWFDNTIYWFENDGSENFTLRTVSTSVNGAHHFDVADLDQDGDVDVVAVARNDGDVIWLVNDGSESFSTTVIDSAVSAANSVQVVDLDSDGDWDVVSAGEGGQLRMAINDGSQNFTNSTVATLTDAHGLGFGDFDGDGDIDLVANGIDAAGRALNWYENDGALSFTEHSIDTLYAGRNLVVADVDNDGTLDFVVSEYTHDAFHAYMNDGAGNFTQRTVGSSATANWAAVADFDGDGLNDVAVNSIAANPGIYTCRNNTVLIGDTDGDGDTLQNVTLVSGPSYASSFILNGDGTFSYTHDGSANLSDSFTYTVDDSTSATSNVATVTITVTPGNYSPVALNDSYSTDEESARSVDWWDTDWSRRQQLTFDNQSQTETLTDVPVLIVLNSGNIDYALTNDDGSDLRFFASDGTALAYEIEQWNESGDSSVWVRVPQIAGSSSTDHIWMYYGNASATAPNVGQVWSSDYVGVWHLNEDVAGTGNSDVYQDSTGGGHDGTDHVSSIGQDGQVTHGQQLGSNDWIEIDHDASLDLRDSMTISFWINPSSDSGTFNRVVEKGLWGYNSSYYFGGGNGTNDLTFYLNGQEVIDTVDNVLTVGVWQHAAVSYTSNGDGTGTARMYLDGVEIATGNYSNGGPVTGNSSRLAIGHDDASYDFDGYIDEVQIESTDRSADWIAAQYKAMNNQIGSEFVTFGGAQTAGSVDGVLTNDSDLNQDQLVVTEVNGSSAAVGSQIVLASGAQLTVQADGTFDYDPNGQFEFLADGASTTDTFTYTVDDGAGGTTTSTVTMTIHGVNDAPVLVPYGPVYNTTEDGASFSATIAGLLQSSLFDLDSGAVEGVALVGFSGSGGTLEYSLDGTNWSALPSVSSGAALLLRTTDSLRFTPATDNGGTLYLDYRGWDQTSGTAGTQVDTSTTGGSTAFSTASDQVTINVAGVNDDPTTSQVVLTGIAEDSGSRTITQAELLANASDVDGDSLTATGLAINTGLGSLVDNGDGTWDYTPAADDDASVTFTYTITDGTANVAGSASLDITPANDAPVIISPSSVAVPEDQAMATTILASDVDLDTVTFSISGGVDAAEFTINSSTGALSFVAAPDYESPTDSGLDNVYDVQVTASDGQGGLDVLAISVHVNPANTEWSISGSASVDEGNNASYTISYTGTTAASVELTLSDIDTNSADYANLVNAVSAAVASRADLTFDGIALSFTPPVTTDYGLNYENSASNFQDISGTGAVLAMGDDVAQLRSIGFNFDFYGTTYSQLYVNDNGYLTFGGTASEYNIEDFSTGATIGNLPAIAPMWADFNTGSVNTGDVYAQTTGSVGSRELVIQYHDVVFYDFDNVGATVTFQVVLFEGSNDIEFRYLDVSAGGGYDNGLYATIGISDGAGDYRQHSYHSASISSGSSIYVTAPGGGMDDLVVNLAIVDDATEEPDEDFSVLLSNPVSSTLSVNSSITTTIDGNVSPTITSSDTIAANENQTSVTMVTATDADGDGVTFTISGGADSGLFSITSGGFLTFDAARDYEDYTDADSDGSYDVEVTVDDGNGGFDVQEISVTVTNVNEKPSDITPNVFSVNENTDTTGGFSLGDLSTSDPDSVDSFIYSVVGGVDQAKFGIGGGALDELILVDGLLDYETQSSYEVAVRTTDAGGEWYEEILTVAVNDRNDAPTTAPVTLVAIAEDSGARTITQAELLANASDVDGDSLTATGLAINTGLGSLVDNGDGTWDYTPVADDDTSVTFTYTITDGTANVAGSASLDITPVNDAPTTAPVTLVAIAEDSGARTITQAELLASATDVDGDSLTATGLAINTGLGSLVDNGDGTWDYTPAAGDDTSVSFTYTITDGTATVAGSASLDITPVNDAPTTAPVTLVAIAEDSGARTITQAELLASANDVDGDSLTATGLAINTGLGSLVDNGDGTWGYTPAADDDTSVSFTYTITDGTANVAGTASLDITPVNDAPTTTPVTLVAIAEDSGARTITQAELLANANDADGDSLTAIGLAINTGLGSLVDNGDGTWDYTPATGDDTSVTFTCTITDGTANVAGSASLDIMPVNDAPTTAPVTLVAIAEDSGARTITQAKLLANANDVDGDSLTATGLVINTGLGSLVDNGDGTWDYTSAAGDDTSVSFTYTITDGTATVAGSASLDITAVNDAPTTAPVTLVAIAEDSGARTITQAELLANASDADGDSLTATRLAINTGLGSLVDNGDGTWDYTPAAGDDTSVSFTYTITDGTANVAGSASLDVTPVNDAPTTAPVTLMAIAEDSGARTITQAELLASANDADGDSLTAIGLAINTGLGSLVDNGDGTWDYTPAAGDDTSVSFTYTITDGTANVAGSASLDITPVERRSDNRAGDAGGDCGRQWCSYDHASGTVGQCERCRWRFADGDRPGDQHGSGFAGGQRRRHVGLHARRR